MTDKKKFFYNGVLLTAVGLTMRTVALFFNAYVTQAVGAEGVGLYTIVMTVYNFAVTFAASGISLTVTRLVAASIGEGRPERTSAILRGAIIYALLFSVAATLVLFFGASFIALTVLKDVRAEACLRILSASLVPVSLISVITGYFIGVRRVAFNAAAQIFAQVFRIALTVSLISTVARKSVEAAAVVLAVGTTLTEAMSLLILLIEFLLERRRRASASGADVKEVAKTAVPLSLSAYVRQALLTLEHILIPRLLERRGETHARALSSYGTLHGMALPMILYPMASLSSFSGLLVPEFAEKSAVNDSDGMRRVCEKAFSATLVFAIGVAAFLYVFSEDLGYVVYDSYPAGKYIAILAPVVPVMYLDHVTDSVLKGIGEHVYSMWINITDSLLSVALVWLLIPRMGIAGYAVCIIVMEGYNFTLSAIRLLSKIKVRISLVRSVVYPAAAAIASALLSDELFISAGAQTGGFLLTLKIVFASCIFFALYKLFVLIDDRIRGKTKKSPKERVE